MPRVAHTVTHRVSHLGVITIRPFIHRRLKAKQVYGIESVLWPTGSSEMNIPLRVIS